MLDKIFTCLSSLRFSVSDEKSMQAALGAELTRNGVPFVPEWDAAPYGRVDFLANGIAIELKIKGGKASVQRQLERYAKHTDVTSIILVSTRRQLCFMPKMMNNKPVVCIYAGSSF